MFIFLHLLKQAQVFNETTVNDTRYEHCFKMLTEETMATNCSIRTELRRIVNYQDPIKNTALHYAAALWSQDVVRTLLELGANIAMTNLTGEVKTQEYTIRKK